MAGPAAGEGPARFRGGGPGRRAQKQKSETGNGRLWFCQTAGVKQDLEPEKTGGAGIGVSHRGGPQRHRVDERDMESDHRM